MLDLFLFWSHLSESVNGLAPVARLPEPLCSNESRTSQPCSYGREEPDDGQRAALQNEETEDALPVFLGLQR